MKYIIYSLLCACTLFVFQSCTEKTVTISIENTSSIDRKKEMVEVDFDLIRKRLSLKDNNVILTNTDNIQVPYQLLSDGKTMIFPVNVAANSTATYQIKAGTPSDFRPLTFGRFVPERLDDFAWENDRMAYRMYGPALAPQNPSNGVDMWLKRTEDLIIDKWYKEDLARVASYHVDHGQGLDCYRVAHTLGAGGIAPFVDDVLWINGPYSRYEIHENGPLRTEFTLYYDALNVGFPDGRCVSTPHRTLKATLTISLDAGNQLNKASIIYEGDDVNGMSVAPGLFLHRFDNINERNVPVAERNILKANNMMAIAIDAVSDANVHSGRAYKGIIVPASVEIKAHEDDCFVGEHLLAVGTFNAGQPFVYYFGGGWNKWGFETDDDWFAYMRNAQIRIEQPLRSVIR
jgi:hypothetical protein